MEVRILGPLEVWAGERQVEIGGGKQRALLAILLLQANEVVSSDRLIDELWEEPPPATAAKALHVLVSQLRRALGSGDALVTRAPGYALRLEPGSLDTDRFESLLAEGRRALAGGEAESAASLLREALALWRRGASGRVRVRLVRTGRDSQTRGAPNRGARGTYRGRPRARREAGG